MTAPTIPFYPITHDDGVSIANALNNISSAMAIPVRIIADEFDPSVSYSINDYCIYNGSLYRFTSAHTGAWVSSHVTQIVVADELTLLSALIESRMTFKITGTVSSGNYTLTDARINDEHWEVAKIYFATPSNVISGISWTTNITQHTVSLSATYAGATNVVVKMHWVQ